MTAVDMAARESRRTGSVLGQQPACRNGSSMGRCHNALFVKALRVRQNCSLALVSGRCRRNVGHVCPMFVI
jgi:hypothetical protein